MGRPGSHRPAVTAEVPCDIDASAVPSTKCRAKPPLSNFRTIPGVFWVFLGRKKGKSGPKKLRTLTAPS
jgi:hypothetical protein